ncbi:tRNA lysidine(34) synthetase TilS [Aporhodopirellula aestuarii]|uniref:tRNA(Ile)-lysidine synthase n=1 Tax=Aporhodopirellula aestuarii TaxID=2950107 RepID=A0ABT0U9Y3_9BACT|nr:tRNA lysidine(34) synthetase TilS [Aporhodopirellula aestuarii]MCM2373494.1 tRNA lysidine(34) synthetase TilS [Aporhodopirellula aestuarii]
MDGPPECFAWRSLRDTFRSDWSDEASDVGVIVGCSGGADSVALVRLIVERYRERFGDNRAHSPPLRIGHFNHRLRADQSDADEQFVVELADTLGVPVDVGRSSDPSSPDAEAGLRQDRRDFFLKTAAATGCRYVALAHTADDQAETILHHLLRGTGSAGMKGMQSARPLGSDFVIRRPLLKVRREDIRTALRQIGQAWREDASNSQTRYTRNWIRHEAMPLLRQRFPKADEAIVRAAENQTQLDGMVSRLARQWIDAFVIDPPDAMEDGREENFRSEVWIRRPVASRPGVEQMPHSTWPHSSELANEVPIITAACQIVFAELGWPRRDMNRNHWMRLAEAIATDAGGGSSSDSDTTTPPLSAVSIGHWPGHLEGFQSAHFVRLRWERRGEIDN